METTADWFTWSMGAKKNNLICVSLFSLNFPDGITRRLGAALVQDIPIVHALGVANWGLTVAN